MYQTEYRVKGSGHFPMDMLRYDTSYPRTTDDATAVGATARDWPGEREVELIKHAVNKLAALPTEARWASFGWRVIEVRRPYKM